MRHSPIPTLLRSGLRLIGFSRIELAPGQTQHVSIATDPRLLADFDTTAHGWRIKAGDYGVMVARSTTDSILKDSVTVEALLLTTVTERIRTTA